MITPASYFEKQESIKKINEDVKSRVLYIFQPYIEKLDGIVWNYRNWMNNRPVEYEIKRYKTFNGTYEAPKEATEDEMQLRRDKRQEAIQSIKELNKEYLDKAIQRLENVKPSNEVEKDRLYEIERILKGLKGLDTTLKFLVNGIENIKMKSIAAELDNK